MKKLLSFVLGLALVILSSRVALAQTPTGLEKARTVQAEKATSPELRQDKATHRCEVIQKRFEVQIARYENNTEKHTARYERMQARLDVLVTKLKEAGTDTTELETALGVLDEKIDRFAHNATSFVESLKLAQQFACEDSTEGFIGQVTETRSLLQILRDDVLDIRTYWQETLRPMITDLIEASEESEASEASEKSEQ